MPGCDTFDEQELLDPFYASYTCRDARPFYLVCPSHRAHQAPLICRPLVCRSLSPSLSLYRMSLLSRNKLEECSSSTVDRFLQRLSLHIYARPSHQERALDALGLRAEVAALMVPVAQTYADVLAGGGPEGATLAFDYSLHPHLNLTQPKSKPQPQP